jgi:hypothetical protein
LSNQGFQPQAVQHPNHIVVTLKKGGKVSTKFWSLFERPMFFITNGPTPWSQLKKRQKGVNQILVATQSTEDFCHKQSKTLITM